MVPWEKRYLEGSDWASKEKAYIARKIFEIETKDNPYIYIYMRMINKKHKLEIQWIIV